MKKFVALDGQTGEFRMTSLTPERGQVNLRRWGMVGARATSFARLFVDGNEAVFMDLIPRDVIFDGFIESIYSEDEHRFHACVIGGLRTVPGLRERGYATALLTEVIAALRAQGTIDFICNFVLAETLDYFLKLGWEAMPDTVKVTILQPVSGPSVARSQPVGPTGGWGAAVPLPDKFTFMVYPLKAHRWSSTPKESVEFMGLPS